MSESRDESIHIEPSAIVSDKAILGKGTRIWHFAQVRENAVIGEGCNIGKGVYIDFNVRIGSNVKVQNFVSVYHGVIIEDDVFVGPHVTFTNDMYPRSFTESWEVFHTTVKRGASIGANSTIICGHTIGEYAMIGAGSVVTGDVPSHALIVGNPARIIHAVCTCGKPLLDEEAVKGRAECEHCGKSNTIPHEVVEALKQKIDGEKRGMIA